MLDISLGRRIVKKKTEIAEEAAEVIAEEGIAERVWGNIEGGRGVVSAGRAPGH